MPGRWKVFISYSHKDEARCDSRAEVGVGYPRAFLTSLKAAIQAHEGLLSKDEIFFDDERLSVEAEWRPAIGKALDECELLIFLVSPHSVLSEFCMTTELARALQRNIHVITVLLRPLPDWYGIKVRNPESGATKLLGEWHSGGLPKVSGNAKPVSDWGAQEDAAWANVTERILAFIKAHPFKGADGASAPPDPAPPQPIPAPLPDSGPAFACVPEKSPVPVESALCAALRAHLEQHWTQARLAEVFADEQLIVGVELPASPDTVMRFVCATDDCCVTLAEAVGCLRACKGKPDLGEPVEGALVRMILVIAETYLRAAAVEAGYQPGREEPVWEQEILMASLIAAERMGFGLCFKGGKREPECVYAITPPAEVLGDPDEAGPGLVRSEVMRALDRSQVASGNAISAGYLKATVTRRRRDLKADVVVTALADGAYAQPGPRAALQDFLAQYEIHAFFRSAERQDVPQWALAVIGDLQNALAEAFPPETKTGAEQKMANPAKDGSNGNVVNNYNINASGGAVNFGDHAKVAGRDIHAGSPADWNTVAQALTALQASIAALADGVPQKTRLLADLKEVSAVVETGKPSEGDARLVKRCLEGLKQGAEAVENGGKIVEKISPVWDGLKAAWPAFLALIS